ncbi:Uncharacterized protein Fot_34519 [Forsythia ovata]|uniref:Uncharacterized protein n=1 Tax=Forsythia ovata TaxID=205694 RepID=A0ABD1SJM3_9LAMI
MASSRQFQECFDSFDCKIRRGSKAQMCLHKILRIISTVPPRIATVNPPSSVSETEKKGSEVEFFELKEMVEESHVYTASGVGLSLSSTTVGTGGPPDLHGGRDSRLIIGSCSSGSDECDQLVAEDEIAINFFVSKAEDVNVNRNNHLFGINGENLNTIYIIVNLISFDINRKLHQPFWLKILQSLKKKELPSLMTKFQKTPQSNIQPKVHITS